MIAAVTLDMLLLAIVAGALGALAGACWEFTRRGGTYDARNEGLRWRAKAAAADLRAARDRALAAGLAHDLTRLAGQVRADPLARHDREMRDWLGDDR